MSQSVSRGTGYHTTHHTAVRKAVERFDTGISTQLIGSLQRRTRIPPKADTDFDIDILICLGTFYNWTHDGIFAVDALNTVNRAIYDTDRYADKNPSIDAPTITFDYKDNTKVELVPAYLDMIGQCPSGEQVPPQGRGYWIPSNTGVWIHADYDYDSEQLTECNKVCDGWLIPTIKMLKAIRRDYFQDMSSFHLEVLAFSIVPWLVSDLNSKGQTVTYPQLITGFFFAATDMISEQRTITGSNSQAVMLDNPEPTKTTFQGMGQYCFGLTTESEVKQIEGWQRLFPGLLPGE